MLPHWAQLTHARRTYNARSETVATLPSFKNAWKKLQTCLIPVENFYEPYYEPNGDGTFKKPVRHAIGRRDEALTLLAGLWEMRREEDGTERRTFTMLTINADGHPLMGKFHAPGDEKRSVVPLAQPDWATWLKPEGYDDLRALLKPFDAALYRDVPRPIPPRKPKAKPSADDLLGGDEMND